MEHRSDSFDGSRDDTHPPDDPLWTVRKHLCWAAGLLGMGLLAVPVDGVKGLHSAPILCGLGILVHGITVATVQRDRVEKVFQPFLVLLGVGWLVSHYLIGITKLDSLGYSIGAVLVAGFWVWDRRNRAGVTAAQAEMP